MTPRADNNRLNVFSVPIRTFRMIGRKSPKMRERLVAKSPKHYFNTAIINANRVYDNYQSSSTNVKFILHKLIGHKLIKWGFNEIEGISTEE